MLINNIIGTRKKIFLSVFGVTVTSILNVILGFAFQMLLAAYFGVGQEMDVYLIASTVPNILTVVLLSSLLITFIPVYTKYQIEGKEEDSWIVIKGFLLLMVMILVVVSALLIYFAKDILLLSNPGLIYKSESYYLALDLYYILIPSICLVGIANLLRSIYQARKHFLKSAWSPVVNSIGLLIGTILLHERFGIYSVAIATTFSAFLQCLFMLPILFRGIKVNLLTAIFHPGIRKILLLMIPWIMSALFSKSNTMIDRFFASQFEEGSISALGYAHRLMTALSLITSQGISAISFSVMSHYAASDDIDNLRTTSAQSFRIILLAVIPISIAITIFSEHIIFLIFQRGGFNQQATKMTAAALNGYMLAFVVATLNVIISNTFYSLQDTVTSAKVGIFGFFINIIAAVLITPYLGFIGSAVAYSIAMTFNFVVLLVILSYRLKGFELLKAFSSLWKIVLSTTLASVIWMFSLYFVGTDFSYYNVMLLVFFGVIGILVFVFMGWWLRIPELVYVWKTVKEKIIKKMI